LATRDILEQVKAAGVVGAGGAGFPTHVKLAAQVDTVIANGAECEPLLHGDQHLMTRYPEVIVQGLRTAMQATGAKRGIVALKGEYAEAIAALESVVKRDADISLHLLGNFYPSGDEFILVYDVLKRLVPEGGIPLEVGVVVNNVGTLLNVARAVEGVPVTHRYLTVTGQVHQPATLRVPIGTSFAQVVTWAGGVNDDGGRLAPADLAFVAGGAMMGRVVEPTDVVTKTTGGLLVLPANGAVVRWMTRPLANAVRRGMSTCDQCRDCTDLCPRNLLGHALVPHEIMRAINYGLEQPTHIITAAVLCCECRLCEAYACPLDLSPMAYYRSVKRKLAEAGWKNTVHRRRDLTPHEMFDYRRVPMPRLIDKLGLTAYRGLRAALDEHDWQPQEVRIPLKQHTGVPAVPVVKAGSRVRRGDLIASIPEGKLGAEVHASVSGRVVDVTARSITIESD
jgi:Na+-translocating ferredoxin:NAD+ oxidoreductase RnfC subunit